MKIKNYEPIDHTADIGIRVKGKDLKELFKKAALALFDILAVRKPACAKAETAFKITQSADSREELFINWLNELLSLSSAKLVIFTGFKITGLSACAIEASATAEPMKHFTVNSEIKAATYHQLKLSKEAFGWQAEVILDV